MNINENNFYIEGCMLFEKAFISDNGKLLAIHELWKTIEDDDECYNQNLSPYCLNYFSDINAPDDYLDIQDMKFMENIEKCNKLSLFFYYPLEMKESSQTKFYYNNIYDTIQESLICIGYNVTSCEGSALTDGIYPIYLDNDIYGSICHNEKIKIPTNQFGLIDKLSDCLQICEINNVNQENARAYWIPQKLYVDQYTYSVIKKS